MRGKLIVSGDDLNHLIDPARLFLRVTTSFVNLNAGFSDDCLELLYLLVRKRLGVGQLDGTKCVCDVCASTRHDKVAIS